MGLIARVLEEQGIATVCVVMNRDIVEAVKVPRALYVHFPYGAPLGPSGERETQAEVVREALDLLVNAKVPGTVVESGVEWPE